MTTPYIPPWSPDFTNEANAITAEVAAAAQQAINDVTQAAGAVVKAGGQAVTTDLGNAVHDAITGAQKAAAKQVEQVIIGALQQVIPAAPTGAVVVETKVITNAAARGRAARSLFYGMGLTILWALVTTIGDAASGGQVDFFTKTGWISVATLAAGTIAHAVLSYVGRVKFTPNSPE